MSLSKNISTSQETRDMFISSTFKFIEARSIDSKTRVTLGGAITRSLTEMGPVESFNMFVDNKGNVLLVPMQHIPTSEMWTWINGEIKESFDRANADIVEGRVKEVTDLDAFLDEL